MTASRPQHVAVDLEALERLLEKATFGLPLTSHSREGRHFVMSQAVNHPNSDGLSWTDVAYMAGPNGCSEDDAELLAQAVSALPSLISELKSLRERAGGGGAGEDDPRDTAIAALRDALHLVTAEADESLKANYRLRLMNSRLAALIPPDQIPDCSIAPVPALPTPMSAEEIARRMADGFTNGVEQFEEADETQKARYVSAAQAILAGGK